MRLRCATLHAVATREFGIRDLRNRTSAVLDAVEAGDVVYLTNRGVRVAEIKSVEQTRRIDTLLRKAARLSTGDSGALDALLADKRDAIESEGDKASVLWG